MLTWEDCRPVTVVATVDSGAYTTCLNVDDASALGLGPHDLSAEKQVGVAGGGSIRVREPLVPIGATVLQREGDELRSWGPPFELRPIFVEAGSRLLGRNDFFRAFEVTFAAAATPPSFVLRDGS